MSTRLITTYEESKALKEAGWPQDRGTIMDAKGLMHPGYVVGEEDSDVAAPRLDELLAVLWERGWMVKITPSRNGRFVSTTTRHVTAGGSLSVIRRNGSDPVAPIAATVIHVLNSERQAPTDQWT